MKSFRPREVLSPRRTSASERVLLKEALFASDKDAQQRRFLWDCMKKWNEEQVRSAGLLTLATASALVPPLDKVLPHVAGYEQLRHKAVSAVIPRVVRAALDGNSFADADALQALTTLAESIPALDREHHQAKALREACLAPAPKALEMLCRLTDGLCRLDGATLHILDHARAEHIAAAAEVEGEEKTGDDDEEGLRQVSLRSYQLWNLWNLGDHLRRPA